MSRPPEINANENIKYDVPYEFMDANNDCWEAALKMLYAFDKRRLDTSGLSTESREGGVKAAEVNGILGEYLKPHTANLTTGEEIYHFLNTHGPALVVLLERPAVPIQTGAQVLHAQIITGRFKSTVFLNNPDNDYATADLSASGGFQLIEQNIMHRYGGLSYRDWQTWVEALVEDDDLGSPLQGRSPSASPPLARRGSFVGGSPAESPVNSRPGSPVLSLAPSPVLSRAMSFAGEESPPLSRAASFGPGLSLTSVSDPPSPRAGPARPGLELQSLRAMLEREFPNSGSAQQGRYIADMEEQFLFRKHRPMSLDTFRLNFVRVNDFAPIWTLKGW